MLTAKKKTAAVNFINMAAKVLFHKNNKLPQNRMK